MEMRTVKAVLLSFTGVLLFATLPVIHASGDGNAYSGFTVYDARNTRVGTVIDLEGADSWRTYARVLTQVNGHLLTVLVSHQQFASDFGAWLIFESGDCSGPAFAGVNGLPSDVAITPVTVVAEPGSRAYVVDLAARRELIAYRSVRGAKSFDTDLGCQAVGFPAQAYGIPAVPVVDLDGLFGPPFTVR